MVNPSLKELLKRHLLLTNGHLRNLLEKARTSRALRCARRVFGEINIFSVPQTKSHVKDGNH